MRVQLVWALLLLAVAGPAAAQPGFVRIGPVDDPDVPVCPADLRATALRAERDSLASRERLPAGLVSRRDYDRLLRIRIAISEQDATALAALAVEVGPGNGNHANLLFSLAHVRSDPRLMREAATAFDREARRWGRGPVGDGLRRMQARALLLVAAAEPDAAAALAGEAAAILAGLKGAGVDADDDALGRAAAEDAPRYATRGPSDASLLLHRQAIAATPDPSRQSRLRQALAEMLLDAAQARPSGRAELAGEASALARMGEAAARAVPPHDAVMERLGGDLTGSWRIMAGADSRCLRVAGWQVLAARAALLLADDAAERAAARQRLSAADARLSAMPPWQQSPRASLELARSWLAAAQALPPAARAEPLAAAGAALDRARQLAGHCFCATIRSSVATLTETLRLASPPASMADGGDGESADRERTLPQILSVGDLAALG